MFFSERLSLGKFKKHAEMSQKRAGDSGGSGDPCNRPPCNQIQISAIENMNGTEAKR